MVEKKRGVGKPARYGERKVHTVKLPDVDWRRLQALARAHGAAGVAELLIKISRGELILVPTKKIQTEDLTDE